MILFVGGIRDGDWFDVPDDRMQWVVRERPKRVTASFDPSAPMEPTYHEQMTYTRQKFSGLKDTYSIFAAPGLTPDDVLLALIKNYEPERPKSHGDARLREVSAATIDAKLLGCGFLMILPDNTFKHVPIGAVSIDQSKMTPVDGEANGDR